MERLVCVAIGYLFGLFQTAYIYGKLHGIDIRLAESRPSDPLICYHQGSDAL